MQFFWIIICILLILLGVYDIIHYTSDNWIFYAGLFMIIINPITITLYIIQLIIK